MSDLYFYAFTEKNNAKRNKLYMSYIVCLANTIILLSIHLNYLWWKNMTGGIIAAILGFFYFVTLLALQHQIDNSRSNLSPYFLLKLRDWSNFYKSKQFATRYNCAISRNNSYLRLIRLEDTYERSVSEILNDYLPEYCRINYKKSGYKYKFSLLDIDTNEVLLESSGNSFNDGAFNLYESIKEKNYDVLAIYNKFGQELWWKSDKERKPKIIRKIIYNLSYFFVIVISAIATILPIFAVEDTW